jgi:hypothetical protein
MIIKDSQYYLLKAEALKDWMALWIEQQDAERVLEQTAASVDTIQDLHLWSLSYAQQSLPPFDQFWRIHPMYLQWAKAQVQNEVKPLVDKLYRVLHMTKVPKMLVRQDGSIDYETDMSDDPFIQSCLDMIYRQKRLLYESLGIRLITNGRDLWRFR